MRMEMMSHTSCCQKPPPGELQQPPFMEDPASKGKSCLPSVSHLYGWMDGWMGMDVLSSFWSQG